jgi:PilZ domain
MHHILVVEDSITQPEQLRLNRRVERRSSPRYLSGRTGCCRALWGGREERWTTTVQDISLAGGSLVLGRRFEPGSLLTVELPTAAGEPVRLMARVVRAQAHTAKGWLIGCALLDPLDEDELRALL